MDLPKLPIKLVDDPLWVKPIVGGPQAQDLPTEVSQDAFAYQITISCSGGPVVSCAVAFNSGQVATRIVVLRGQRVMLDADLAALYGVATKRLNEQVRRNAVRFPPDFMFQLTTDERDRLKWSQNATTLRRTSRTSSRSTRRADQLPLAFTEHGCLMLANVLRSGRAVEVSVLVVRAFVRMRSALAANADLAVRMEELARELERQGGKLATHDAAILKILAEIRRLTQFPELPRRGIGFTAEWPGTEMMLRRGRLASLAADNDWPLEF